MEVAEKGFTHKAERMLNPPVNMLGIPAMRKLAKEIIDWREPEWYKHMVAYAGMSPPLVDPDLSHNDGLRFEFARVLAEMGRKYHKKEWTSASDLFDNSGELIIEMCRKAVTYDGAACSGLLKKIADTEEAGYKLLA